MATPGPIPDLSPAEIQARQAAYFLKNCPLVGDRLMAHEGTQLAIALGVASEGMDVVLQNESYLPLSDFPGQCVTINGILDPTGPPLQQMLWKDSPLNVTVVSHVSEVEVACKVFERMTKELAVGEFNVLLFTDSEAPLFEGGLALGRRLPWRLAHVSKVHRLVATASGTHLQAWFLGSNSISRCNGPEALFKVVRLLPPGCAPRMLYVSVPPPPERLWAICIPFPRVPEVLRAAGVAVEAAVVLPGFPGLANRWILLRDTSQEVFDMVEKEFYHEDGSAFCSYKTFKGTFPPDSHLVQIFWRKALRSPDQVNILWRCVDYQLKQRASEFDHPPQLQWAGANKLRLALSSPKDFAAFLQHILPLLKHRGLILKDEQSGEFLDEDGPHSDTGRSSTSGTSSLGSTLLSDAIVITDLPDFFLSHDVEGVVRSAMKTKQAVGADILPLRINKLDWSMGSPMSPTWQVSGNGIGCLEGTMLSFSLEGAPGLATVMPWKEYATARAAWRARKLARPQHLPRDMAPSPSAAGVSPPLAMDVDEEEALRAKRSRDG